MHKDFKNWANKKETIHFQEKGIPFFNEGEIWWCILGINIGQEQDGKHQEFERPVLILKKFNKNILWILPITSKIKNEIFYYPINYNGEVQSIILSQLRLISSKRLLRKIRSLSVNEFSKIKLKVIGLLS